MSMYRVLGCEIDVSSLLSVIVHLIDCLSIQSMSRITHQTTRQSTMPPSSLSTHSLASMSPRSVSTNRHSPVRVRPLTVLHSLPRTTRASSRHPSVTRRVGLLTICSRDMTGSAFQYFSPSHRRRVATFVCVVVASSDAEGVRAWDVVEKRRFVEGDVDDDSDGDADEDELEEEAESGGRSVACGMLVGVRRSGGFWPARMTVEMKPAFCSAVDRARLCFVDGTDVSASRALEAFCRCEHMCESVRSIFMGVEGARPVGLGVRRSNGRFLCLLFGFEDLNCDGKVLVCSRVGISAELMVLKELTWILLRRLYLRMKLVLVKRMFAVWMDMKFREGGFKTVE